MSRVGLCIAATVVTALSMGGCPELVTLPPVVEARVETTGGAFELELFPEAAPANVTQFISLAQSGFYSDTIFHNVVDNRLIEGGAFLTDFSPKPGAGAPVINESFNGLFNEQGAVALVWTEQPDDAVSRFLINVSDNLELDAIAGSAGFTVFGRVTGGFPVVQAIAVGDNTPRDGFPNAPTNPVVIQSVTITTRLDDPQLTAFGRDYANAALANAFAVGRDLLVQAVAFGIYPGFF